jgi:hypothetical protein
MNFKIAIPAVISALGLTTWIFSPPTPGTAPQVVASAEQKPARATDKPLTPAIPTATNLNSAKKSDGTAFFPTPAPTSGQLPLETPVSPPELAKLAPTLAIPMVNATDGGGKSGETATKKDDSTKDGSKDKPAQKKQGPAPIVKKVPPPGKNLPKPPAPGNRAKQPPPPVPPKAHKPENPPVHKAPTPPTPQLPVPTVPPAPSSPVPANPNLGN